MEPDQSFKTGFFYFGVSLVYHTLVVLI